MVAKRTVSVVVVVVLFCMTSFAAACPWCDGGPSGFNPVKAEIFGDGFCMRAAAVLAPFPVLAGIVAIIYFGTPKIGPRSEGVEDGSRNGNQP